MHFSSPTVVARLVQNHTSCAAVDFDREIKEPYGGLLIRLLHRTCPRESNALPSHISNPYTVRLQVYLKDDSLLSSDNDFTVSFPTFWVLEETFQANTRLGISGTQAEYERDHTCDMTDEQRHRINDSD